LKLKKLLFLLLFIPLFFLIVYFSRHIMLPLIVAFFLAYALNPIVELLQRKGARRDWAILTIYLVMFIIGAMILELLIPRLIHDLTAVIRKLPVIITELKAMQIRLDQYLAAWHLPFNLEALTGILTKRSEALFKDFLIQFGQSMVRIFSQSLFYLLIPLIAYYISRDYPTIKEHIMQWALRHLGNHWTHTLLRIDAVFKYYIRSQLLDILIVGTLFAIGLSLLGFEAAILLGFMAGVFNIIPYFGPALGALPLILFALLKSPWLVVYVIVLFFAVNQIEVIFLAPRIISCNLKLHPVTVIYLIMLGGEVFGLAGMVFAVPLGAIAGILFRSVYEICFD
jgi:predicted PurR-regulated permease PerM